MMNESVCEATNKGYNQSYTLLVYNPGSQTLQTTIRVTLHLRIERLAILKLHMSAFLTRTLTCHLRRLSRSFSNIYFIFARKTTISIEERSFILKH